MAAAAFRDLAVLFYPQGLLQAEQEEALSAAATDNYYYKQLFLKNPGKKAGGNFYGLEGMGKEESDSATAAGKWSDDRPPPRCGQTSGV